METHLDNMIYINDNIAKELLEDSFEELIPILEKVVELKRENQVNQPLKPYLKFPEINNRIIAMPAYVGGEIKSCGIKWIASFPANIVKGLRRANCVTILNSIETGEPLCIINSPELSIYRTAAVSGMILNRYVNKKKCEKFTVGIIGYGPIGKKHEEMCYSLLGEKLKNVLLYDLKRIRGEVKEKSLIEDSWEQVYRESDILITCTTSEKPYITMPPKRDSITLNVSLRDFDINCMEMEQTLVLVDDWDEVNRENTNIQTLSEKKKINREECIDVYDFLHNEIELGNRALFFNPMGLAIFDIAVGKYMYNKAVKEGKVYELS